jgi:hypothetical protein
MIAFESGVSAKDGRSEANDESAVQADEENLDGKLISLIR